MQRAHYRVCARLISIVASVFADQLLTKVIYICNIDILNVLKQIIINESIDKYYK